tara:strand:- start:2395 stop:2616 length:222 start_codon:yes stop_codon:yes gene_type:complete
MDNKERLQQVIPLRMKLDYYGLTKDIEIIANVYKLFDNYIKLGKGVKNKLFMKGFEITLYIVLNRNECSLNLS